MNIKLDEDLPLRLAFLLNDLGHNVHTVADEQLAGCADSAIWEAAQNESRFFITQDLDFSDLRRFTPGTHNGILLIRLRSPSRTTLIDRISDVFQTQRTAEWIGCFVIGTDRKIRLLKPEHKPRL